MVVVTGVEPQGVGPTQVLLPGVSRRGHLDLVLHLGGGVLRDVALGRVVVVLAQLGLHLGRAGEGARVEAVVGVTRPGLIEDHPPRRTGGLGLVVEPGGVGLEPGGVADLVGRLGAVLLQHDVVPAAGGHAAHGRGEVAVLGQAVAPHRAVLDVGLGEAGSAGERAHQGRDWSAEGEAVADEEDAQAPVGGGGTCGGPGGV